jgi:hypothetical protein
MSKERELLKKILATRWLDHELSCEVEALLNNPEQKIVCWGSFNLNNECVGTHETRRFAAQIQGGNEVYPLYTSPLTCDYLKEELESKYHEGYMDGKAFKDRHITIRDHFAGLAMQGLIASGWDNERVGNLAYNMADVMLAEREKRDD